MTRTKDPKRKVKERRKETDKGSEERRRRYKLNSGADVCAPTPLLSSQQKVKRMLMSLARTKRTPPYRMWVLQWPECARRYRAMFFLS